MENNEKKLLDPKEVEIDGKKFIISKFPAFAGREIIMSYPKTHLFATADVEQIKKTVMKLMSYVAIKTDDGRIIRLETEALIENHCNTEFPTETLAKIEAKMLEYNFSFFQNGKALNFLERLEGFAKGKITEMLTTLSDNLLQKNKQRFGN